MGRTAFETDSSLPEEQMAFRPKKWNRREYIQFASPLQRKKRSRGAETEPGLPWLCL